MSAWVRSFLALALFLAAGAAAQEPVPDPAERALEALIREHEASELGRVESYQTFRPRFEEFAKAHRGTEAEAGASLWLIQQTWWLRQDGTMEETSLPLAEDLLERHLESPQLGLLVEYSYVFSKKERKTLYERLAAGSPHPEVKAAAHFGLAKLSPARQEDGAPNPHFAAILEEYADLPWRSTTFGRIADAYLNPLTQEDLAVGRQVPEIEGLDQNGQLMRLLDFRGKVVMLDFWGDW
ncbi:MAG: hypothetical protein V2A76_07985 [Planctomycetota bacterium]